MVQFKNVSKTYTNSWSAIKDISFVIEEGEFVFLIGPSGSGKTTLIKLLIRDEKPSSGKIFFDDQDITHLSRKNVYKLRRKIGVIFQDYKLIKEKTAYENVAFAMEVAGKKNSEIKETVPYVLDIVGLGSRMDAFPVELSGGEQQRVAIARAIANNPKILIADEPTGNLDPASAWDIVQILTKINNWGTTVIMSTHGTDIVNTLNKRVIQMERGIMVRDDNEGQYELYNANVHKKIKTSKKEILDAEAKTQKKSYSLDLNKALGTKKKDEAPDENSIIKKLENDRADDFMEVVANDIDNIPENNVEVEKPKGLFGRLFRRNKQEAIDPEQEHLDDSETEENLDITEDVIEQEPKVLDEVAEEIENDIPVEETKEEESEEPEEVVTEKKSKKKKNSEEAPKDKKGLHINLGLAGSISEEKIEQVSKEEEEMEEVFKKHKNTSVDHLNLPGKIITELKNAGYKKIGDLIKDGPEKLSEKSIIEDEEVVLVAKALEKLILN